MRFAILGSNGQLGRDLTLELASHEVFPLTRQDLDVTDHAKTRAKLTELNPEVIVNTTAFHRVDDCESQPDLAYAVNVLAVLNLVRVSNQIGSALAHFSTDYVFDGKANAPYTEASEPFPLSVYGNSKLAGEYLVRTLTRKYFVIRTCGLYGRSGSRGRGGNFVEIMLKKAQNGERIQVVHDQVLTPTSSAELARQVAVIVQTNHYGLFHMTNEGLCSWYEFAAAIFELAGVRADLSPTTMGLYKAPAQRPAYSVLENAHLKSLGLNRLRHWRDALSEYLESR